MSLTPIRYQRNHQGEALCVWRVLESRQPDPSPSSSPGSPRWRGVAGRRRVWAGLTQPQDGRRRGPRQPARRRHSKDLYIKRCVERKHGTRSCFSGHLALAVFEATQNGDRASRTTPTCGGPFPKSRCKARRYLEVCV